METTVAHSPEKQSMEFDHSYQRPIFIHNMFRTGGTYLWSKFRELRPYRAYYEPLNEVLARPEQDIRASAKNFFSKARHPKCDFYFEELPFTTARGVEYFDESFSFESYVQHENDVNEPLRRYFGHLLTYSMAHQQVPVFKLDRALLRTGWLTANFSPLNILVLRNPLDVWESFKSFGQSAYFKIVLCAILGRNRRHDLLGDLADRFKLPECPASKPARLLKCYRDWVMEIGDGLYPLFFEFYILTTLHSARYADCILDMNGISSRPDLKAAVTRRLNELGIPISLEDCRAPSRGQRQEVRREIMNIEQKCLKHLEGRLPEEFLVPQCRLEIFEGLVDRYFRQILGRFKTGAMAQPLYVPIRNTLSPNLKENALRLIRAGKYMEGAELLAEVLQHKQGPELWNTWATAQAASGNFMSAIAGFRRSLELDPNCKTTIENLSKVVWRQQQAVRRAATKRVVRRSIVSRLPLKTFLRRLQSTVRG